MQHSNDRLSGWKAIAAHFGRDRTTVMRWAQERNMPIHAMPGGKKRTVFAYRAELDGWSRAAGQMADEGVSEAPPAIEAQEEVPVGRRRLLGLSLAAGVAAISGGGIWLSRSGGKPLPADAQAAMVSGTDAFRELTPDQVALAIASFQQAADIAPDRAEPWGQMALAYQASATVFAAPKDADALAERARAAAKRALTADPNNADAAAALAGLVPQYRNWRAAGAALEAVLARHPDTFAINRLAALFYSETGQIHLVQQCTERALKVDDRWPQLVTNMVASNWALGRVGEADRYMARATRAWPRYSNVWFVRQRLLAYTGRAKQALAMIDDVANRPIGIPDWNFAQCRLESQALLTRSSRDVAAAADGYREAARRSYGLAENAAQFLSEFGMMDEAFAMLDAIYFDRGRRMNEVRYSIEQGQYSARRARDTYIFWMPMSRLLRIDARLAPILTTLGLRDYWRATKSGPDMPVADV